MTLLPLTETTEYIKEKEKKKTRATPMLLCPPDVFSSIGRACERPLLDSFFPDAIPKLQFQSSMPRN
jgi:hypothetical protein